VTIRYLSGLTTTHRMNFGGRLFDLSNINNVLERGRWMVITATEGASHGN
jgi:head-tail adaptor